MNHMERVWRRITDAADLAYFDGVALSEGQAHIIINRILFEEMPDEVPPSEAIQFFTKELLAMAGTGHASLRLRPSGDRRFNQN